MPPVRPVLPAAVLAMAERGDDWARWVRRLPVLVDELVDEWSLGLEGDGWSGHTALVLPVVGDDGPAALKVGFPHEESEHEHLVLRRWDGAGAVRLLKASPARGALLLERLHHEDLRDHWDVEACELVGDLYRHLHVPALPQLRGLPDVVARDLERLDAAAVHDRLPRRLVEQAQGLGRDLCADPASRGRVVHTDLHYENVLAADREPWLVIDPKPLDGDPHYEVAPLLWNRWDELAGDVRGGLRRRFHAVVDAAMLDEHRARDWVVVRMLLMAAAPGADDETVTTCVTIAKAVQD